jgi:hypothetical protein
MYQLLVMLAVLTVIVTASIAQYRLVVSQQLLSNGGRALFVRRNNVQLIVIPFPL